MQDGLLVKRFSLNNKSIVIVLRLLVIIVTFFLTIYGSRQDIRPVFLFLVFGTFLVSDIALVFAPVRFFSVKSFSNGIFVLDVVLVSCIIYLTGGLQTDLYLIYFLIIFMASSGRNVAHAFMLTIVVAAIYVFLMAKMGISLYDPGLLLRIPFIFILSFVFLYYAHEERVRIQAEAERKDRLSMIGKMTAEIIHDINNPLTAILGNAQLLSDVDPEIGMKQLWPVIVSQTQKLTAKIKSILEFARSDAGAEKTLIDVTAALDSALDIFKHKLMADGITVTKEFAESIPQVLGNYGALEQVFTNIISNAHYALVKSRQRNERKIAVSAARKGKKVVVRISDNGSGIKSEDVERLFTPFFSTKPEDEGMGLGLSICYKIIKDHKGDISVQSAENAGASFIIELPVPQVSS